VQATPRSRLLVWVRLALEYAFWFGAAILLKLAFSAWVSVPYPSPLWIPVVLLALQHGLAGGLTAALIAAALQFLPGLPPQSLAEDVYVYAGRIAFEPVAWTAAALFIGQLRSREISTLAALKERLLERTRNAEALAELCTHLRQRIETLERHIAANDDTSITDVAEAIINLERAGWEDFAPSLRQLIFVLTGAAEFSVYLLGENGLEPAFVPDAALPGSTHTAINPARVLFRSVVKERRIISASTPAGAALLGDVGIFAGPVFERHGNEVVGMLALAGASLEELPEDIERRFTLACSELSRLVDRIKVNHAWRNAANGHLRESSEKPSVNERGGQAVQAIVADEQTTNLQ
jgi:hypothetical protein